MDALMYTAKDHSKSIIKDTPKINVPLDKVKEMSDSEENMDKFKCAEWRINSTNT